MNKRERKRALIISIIIHIIALMLFSRFGFHSINKLFNFQKSKKEVFMDLKKPETVVTFEKEPPQPKKEEPKEKAEQKPKPEKPIPQEKKEPTPAQKPESPPPLPTPPEPKEQAQLRAAKPTIKKDDEKEKEEIPVRFDNKEKEKLASAVSETLRQAQGKREKKKLELELPKIKPIRVEDIKRIQGEKPSKIPELPKISEEEIKETALSKLLKKGKEQQAPTVKEIPDFAKRSIFSQTKLLLEAYDDGNSVINRRGDPNRMPSLEEMKFISYEQKIHEHLINEWKILYTYSRSMQIQQPTSPVHFSFEIAENGNVFNLELMQGSGSSAFDQMVIRCVQSASPFPSIPKHLGVKTYRPHGLNITVPH